MIQLSGVSKFYPTRSGPAPVFTGVDLTVGRHEHLGIMGRNGAGKSTLIRLIGGAEMPTAGRIERTMSVSWPLAFGGGFQPSLTGLDNLRFICRIYAVDFAERLEYVREFTGLGRYLREPVRVYSSGMRAKLAFAISMAIDFDCFLVDEIVAVGDVTFQRKSQEELYNKRQSRAMVLVSHDHAYLRDNCSRFALIDDHKVTKYDDFEEAYHRYRIMLGLI